MQVAHEEHELPAVGEDQVRRMDAGGGVRERIADELKAAMRARDRVAIGALRSVSAAIANAQAVAVTEPTGGAGGSAHVAGAVGLGATEAERRELTDGELDAIVADEISERETAASAYLANGYADRAERLQQEAAVIRDLVDPTG
jgi:uncharacterized protein YqeY